LVSFCSPIFTTRELIVYDCAYLRSLRHVVTYPCTPRHKTGFGYVPCVRGQWGLHSRGCFWAIGGAFSYELRSESHIFWSYSLQKLTKFSIVEHCVSLSIRLRCYTTWVKLKLEISNSPTCSVTWGERNRVICNQLYSIRLILHRTIWLMGYRTNVD